jgi:hypothetical protein
MKINNFLTEKIQIPCIIPTSIITLSFCVFIQNSVFATIQTPNPSQKNIISSSTNSLIYPISIHWSNGTYYIGDRGQQNIFKFTPEISTSPQPITPSGSIIGIPISIDSIDGNNLVSSDPITCNIYKTNITTGNISILSGPNHGTGPFFCSNGITQTDLYHFVITNYESHSLLSINGITGDRDFIDTQEKLPNPTGVTKIQPNLVAGVETATKSIYTLNTQTNTLQTLVKGQCGSTALQFPYAITTYNNMIYFTDSGLDAVFSINPTTHQCQLVSGLNHGTGLQFVKPIGITATQSGITVLDAGNRALYNIDPRTGDRNILYAATTPLPNAPLHPWDHFTAGAYVYITDETTGSVYQVNRSNLSSRPFSSPAHGRGSPILSSYAITGDNNNLYLSDGTQTFIYQINTQNGDRTIISGNGIGSGPDILDPTSIALDGRGNILVVDSPLQALFKVNIQTGNRSIISGPHTGSGPAITHMFLFSDPSNNEVFASEPGDGIILGINTSTGARIIITSPAHGSGPIIAQPYGVYNLDQNTLLVADNKTHEIYKVNKATGYRTVFSPNTPTFGPLMQSLYSIKHFDDTHVIVDGSTADLYLVNTTTGERTLFQPHN